MGALWTAVTQGLAAVIEAVGTFVTAIISDTGHLHDLLPLFAIGISISLLLLCVRIVKGLIWGE